MDQRDQQNLNQPPQEGQFFQTNPLLVPFQQNMMPYVNQVSPQAKGAQYQSGYDIDMVYQDPLNQQQFPIQQQQQRSAEFDLQQHPNYNQAGYNFYQGHPSLAQIQNEPKQQIDQSQFNSNVQQQRQQPLSGGIQEQSRIYPDQQNLQQQHFGQLNMMTQQQRPINQQTDSHDNERVVTTSLIHKPPQQQTPLLPNMNYMTRPPTNVANQSGMGGIQRQNISGTSQGNSQMQVLVKNFFETIKKGDIDQVLSERNKLGIDVSTLVHEESYKQTPIFFATQIQDENVAIEMVKIFMEMGVKPTQTDTLNQTALYYSSRDGKNNMIELLIAHGCNVNHIDTYGQTPIFYAVREGRLDTIQKLVQCGADLDLVDNNGQTPLYYAIKQGKIEVCEFLMKNGANVNNTDKKGQTPTTWAKRWNKQQIMELLVQYGAPQVGDNKASKAAQAKKQPPPPKQKINERKIPKRFMLTVLKDGYYEPVTEEEYEKFKQENPDLAKYFEEEDAIEKLPVPEVPESAQIYDNWEKAAKRLMNTLWKHNTAWIFYEPVDPEKLNVPDYYDIIKNPMDLGTIKAKLSSNQYTSMRDFVQDVQLVFDNCILYNGESSSVSQMCKSVREEFHKLYDNLSIDYYL